MRRADPLLASLSRHRLVAGLVILQAAVTAALLVMAMAAVASRLAAASAPSGLDEARLLQVQVDGGADASLQRRERQALASLPGVIAVARVNQVPFGYLRWRSRVGARPRMAGGTYMASVYFGDRDLLGALGVRLYAGRAFLPAEYVAEPVRGTGFRAAHVQLSRDLAGHLFPRGDALGGTVYIGERPMRVVGLYDRLQGADPQQTASLVLPEWLAAARSATYLLRLRDAPLTQADLAQAIDQQAGRWPGDVRTLARMRHDWFAPTRMAIASLVLGLALWLVGTGVGMASLADLLLQSRLRQIGLHRALGATAAQVRMQLRRENLLLAGAGTILGLLATWLLWQSWPWLAANLPAPGVPAHALAGMLVLLTGQCALWPVTREANAISPALASRRA